MENILFDFHMKYASNERLPFLIESAGNIFEGQKISGDLNLNIQLVLEEAISNVIIHGYKGKGGYLAISCRIIDEVLEIRITDRAEPFDPTAASPPDITLPPEERKIGGLGIHLIQNIMDDVVYRYENGENILMMKKKLK